MGYPLYISSIQTAHMFWTRIKMVSLPSPPTYYSLANTFNVLVVLYYFVVIFNSHVCQSVRFCFSAQFKLSFLPNCKLLKDFAQVSKKKKIFLRESQKEYFLFKEKVVKGDSLWTII